MGLSSSSSTSKQVPHVSDWMKPTLRGYGADLDNFLNMNPEQFVAPEAPLQTKAFGDVQNLGGWKTTNDQAAAMAGAAGNQGAAQGQAYDSDFSSVLDNGGIQRFIDPQTQSYIDPILSAYDANTGRQRAAMMSQGAKAGAFGGSRFGVAQGDFEAEAGRGRALQLTDLMRGAWDRASGTATSEAGREQQNRQFNAGNQTQASFNNANLQEQSYLRNLQAAGLLGDLSNSYAGNERGDVALTGDLGAQQRGIASEYANALPTQLQIGANLLRAIPEGSYIGSKTKQTSNPGLGGILGSLGSMASSAAVAFSDRRLKTDIERVGSHGPLGLYSFRFHGDQKRRTGVMADDVAIHAPEALGPEINGFATVDYGKLGLAHLVEA